MNKLFYILSICLFVALFSCEDKFVRDIEIEIPEAELQLVINLELTEGDTIAKTFVARTSNINEAESTFFSDAIVELYKENDLLGILDYEIETNEYRANFLPGDLSEGNYTVEVSGIDGFDDIRASQTIPSEVNIIEGTYQEDGTIEQYYGYAYTVDEATIKFKDPADQENYYQIRLFGFIEDEYGSVRYERDFFITSINPFVETSFYIDGILLNDNSFNGQEFNLSIGFAGNYSKLSSAGENETPYLLVQLSNISRDNYLYQRSLADQLNAVDNPFAEPVVVHNNLENGIGIFRTKNTSSFRIDLE